MCAHRTHRGAGGGGVGIVCHQMNSWGETNEECREKEGGILIGLSLPLSHSSLLFSLGEQEMDVGFTEVKRISNTGTANTLSY